MSPSLREYQQQALATADPAGRELSYLIPGIVGEVGEMFGHRAKALWHGKSVEELQKELVLEYGDVAWMAAVLLDTLAVEYVLPRPRPVTNWWGGQPDPWAMLLHHSATLYQWWLDERTHEYLPGAAVQMWQDLDFYALTITGAPFEAVLRANVEKLASRRARGVLQGNGDHR